MGDHQAGNLAVAENTYRKVLSSEPNNPDALHFFGILLHQRGQEGPALEYMQRSIELKPRSAAFHNNLGSVFKDLGRLDRAAKHFGKALSLNSSYAEAYSNLGTVFTQRRNFDEAIAHIKKALALQPQNPEAHSNLGRALTEIGDLESAQAHLKKALSARPDFPEAHYNLGNVFLHKRIFDRAVVHFERALALKPDYPEAHNNLGNALRSQGKFAEAIGCYDKSLALSPGGSAVASNRLFCLLYDERFSAEEIAAEHRGWGETFGRPLRPCSERHRNDRDPDRRLRVGYVSPDFREHAMAYYLEPLLASHDREVVAVHCYAQVTREDDRSARFRSLAEVWVRTVGMSDEALAARIREDGIDILVDLAGHTANNRLLAFARKPAPVQVSYLIGYGQTTGLEAIDYALTNARLSPPGSEAQFTERLHRLPGSALSFQPSPAWPEVTPLPAASNGHVTFASFNDPARISTLVVGLWSEVLRAVPDALLLLKHQSLGDDGVRGRFREAFASEGVAERVEFRGVERGWGAEMGVYGEVDICLDTYPVNGGTTTSIALWMGLPVVTLMGEATYARAGREFVAALGQGEWAAESGAAYVALAVELATDTERLVALRHELRDRMAASALMDHAGLARAIEDAYREMWRIWCAAGAR